jgi:hypothetical protein
MPSSLFRKNSKDEDKGYIPTLIEEIKNNRNHNTTLEIPHYNGSIQEKADKIRNQTINFI